MTGSEFSWSELEQGLWKKAKESRSQLEELDKKHAKNPEKNPAPRVYSSPDEVLFALDSPFACPTAEMSTTRPKTAHQTAELVHFCPSCN